ncbi:MAG: hypothetical protein R3C08_09695 [Hyphomonas sp.]
MIILFSEACNDSKQLRKELALADELNKVVIPVLIENAKPKGHFLFELASRNWLQIFPDPESKLSGLSEKLLEIVGRPTPTSPAIAAPQPVAPTPTISTELPKQADELRTRQRRHFLPFKPMDLPVLLGAPLLIYLTIGLNRTSAAPYEIIIGCLFYGACIVAAYSAIVFPIRYFLRNLKLTEAARYYTMSASAIFAFGAGLLGIFAIFKGSWANDMTTLLILSLFISTVFAVLAFVVYGILIFGRSLKIFRNHIEVI